MLQLPTLLCLLLSVPAFVVSQTRNNSYIPGLYSNDFVSPDWFLSRNFPQSTLGAQQTIVRWAEQLNAQGPWSVTNKSATPPSGDKHDYMSWAPYFWPDCSNVGNKTQLTSQQIWVMCPYVERDGQFNPDRVLITDEAEFTSMSDAVFYNTLAWVITNTSSFSAAAAKYMDVWFLNSDTMMNPNLNYAQLTRGPNGAAQHTGLLDLKAMARISVSVMILRKGNSPDWTSNLDTQMMNWTTSYLNWMLTNPLGIEELASANNHGTFCYNQLSALQVMVGNSTGAKMSLSAFFTGAYMKQISANGDQPFESVRTHPFHYRAYNLEALITNARIGAYLGVNYWNTTTSAGSTIKTALDYAMQFNVTASGDGPTEELFPDMAAVAAVYGDPGNQYADYMKNRNENYPGEPYFLFNQPLSDNGLPAATPDATGPAVTPTSSSSTRSHSGVTGRFDGGVVCWLLMVIVSASTLSTLLLG
jgi:hypothetical protein